MAETAPQVQASLFLRRRLCDPSFVFAPLKSFPDSNYSKLKFIISSSINEGCNNSVLLLGPRGSGKIAVLELVLEDLKLEYPDVVSVTSCVLDLRVQEDFSEIRLNGVLHGDDNCGLKEIAKQLCYDHGLLFSKMASSDDNTRFLIDMLRECGLAHKTIIFALDEFDLFAQGKQRLLYGLLDAMQTLTSQAVVIGVSCRLDADQLLEKRVRSRFSHRKILFVPSSEDDLRGLVEHILYLPTDLDLPGNFVAEFNSRIHNVLHDKKFVDLLNSLLVADNSVSNLLRFIYRAVSLMNMESGFLSLDNFKNALTCLQRQPKQESILNASILELYLLVCMHRLEIKEQNSYNFNTVMKEYKSIHDAYKTSDYHGRNVCLRAFEHLLQRELISFADNKKGGLSIEFRQVKLLVSLPELSHGLKSYPSCPVILQKLLEHETYK